MRASLILLFLVIFGQVSPAQANPKFDLTIYIYNMCRGGGYDDEFKSPLLRDPACYEEALKLSSEQASRTAAAQAAENAEKAFAQNDPEYLRPKMRRYLKKQSEIAIWRTFYADYCTKAGRLRQNNSEGTSFLCTWPDHRLLESPWSASWKDFPEKAVTLPESVLLEIFNQQFSLPEKLDDIIRKLSSYGFTCKSTSCEAALPVIAVEKEIITKIHSGTITYAFTVNDDLVTHVDVKTYAVGL